MTGATPSRLPAGQTVRLSVPILFRAIDLAPAPLLRAEGATLSAKPADNPDYSDCIDFADKFQNALHLARCISLLSNCEDQAR